MSVSAAKKFWLFFAVIMLSTFVAAMAWAFRGSPINPQHRVCETTNDCAIIYIGCVGCNSTGYRATVNKKFASVYKELGACTAAEIARMSYMECKTSKPPTPVCTDGRCTMSGEVPE